VFIKREDYKTFFRISQDENYFEEESFQKILTIFFFTIESEIIKLCGEPIKKDIFIKKYVIKYSHIICNFL